MQGPASQSESGSVYGFLLPLFNLIGIVDADTCTFIIRKTAHFTEYAVLGAGALNFVKSLFRWREPSRRLLIGALCAFALVPVADETLQLFVPGRSGAVRDVVLDLCGYVTGIGIATLVVKHRRKA